MKEITQIRKLSLWIFFIPLIAINLCLFISINYDLLENTIFAVDQIGRTAFTIPYIDGSLSISRASRTYPAFLIFKPGNDFNKLFSYIFIGKKIIRLLINLIIFQIKIIILKYLEFYLQFFLQYTLYY